MVLSHKSVHVDSTDDSTSWSENFLMVFGTPTLLWEFCTLRGTMNRPSISGMKYTYKEVELENEDDPISDLDSDLNED